MNLSQSVSLSACRVGGGAFLGEVLAGLRLANQKRVARIERLLLRLTGRLGVIGLGRLRLCYCLVRIRNTVM